MVSAIDKDVLQRSLTSEETLFFNDGGEEWFMIANEPYKIKDDSSEKYVGERHGADFILGHN